MKRAWLVFALCWVALVGVIAYFSAQVATVVAHTARTAHHDGERARASR